MNSPDSGLEIVPADGAWKAVHTRQRVDGPRAILCGGDCLARDAGFYLDDFAADLMLCDRFRAYHKGGVAVVEAAGHYPFGAEVAMMQSWRYGARHVRVVSDLGLPRGATVRREVGIGCVFLPGPWQRFYCIPSCQDLAEGRVPGWVPLPAAGGGSGEIAHWRRPPLALVFERPNGTRLEVGTGGDAWRWTNALGCAAGAASYAVLAEADGLRVLRRPLVTETEIQPQPRRYRLTWYLAWQPAGDTPPVAPPGPEPVPVRFSAQGEALLRDLGGGAASPVLVVDLADWPCLAQRRRAASPAAVRRNDRSPSPCWESAGVQKGLRRVIRQIAALGPCGVLVWRGLGPGPCWDPTHCDRQGQPLPHWDMDAVLDLGTWGRQQLGPGWQVRVEAPGWEMLPSLMGLFAPTGFGASADEIVDG